jgi:hypothetical protein
VCITSHWDAFLSSHPGRFSDGLAFSTQDVTLFANIHSCTQIIKSYYYDRHLLFCFCERFVVFISIPILFFVTFTCYASPRNLNLWKCFVCFSFTKDFSCTTHKYIHMSISVPMVQQPPVGPGLLIETSRSHSDTPHSVGLLWTGDQPDAVSSTLKHTKITRYRYPCHRRDSNPQSHQASSRYMPIYQTAYLQM